MSLNMESAEIGNDMTELAMEEAPIMSMSGSRSPEPEPKREAQIHFRLHPVEAVEPRYPYLTRIKRASTQNRYATRKRSSR